MSRAGLDMAAMRAALSTDLPRLLVEHWKDKDWRATVIGWATALRAAAPELRELCDNLAEWKGRDPFAVPPPGSDRSPVALQRGWAVSLQAAGELRIKLAGRWVLASGACSSGEISRCLEATPAAATISFDVQDLGPWDNVLIDFLNKIETIAGERRISIDHSALPGGVARLLALARAVPAHRDARHAQSRPDPLTRIGAATQTFLAATADFVGFVGETSAAVGG
jgi:hypothetical protein